MAERAYTTDELDAMERGGYTTEQLDAMEREGATAGPPRQTAPGSLLGQKIAAAYKSVAEPVTRAVKVPFDLAGQLDVALGIKTPEQAASRADLYSKLVVPQDLPQAGAAAGTMLAGPLGPAARIAAAGVGAGLGAAAEGRSLEGQVLPAGLAAGTTAVVEGASKLGSALVRGLSGSKQRVADIRARKLGEVMEETSPGLGAPTSTEAIRDLASGPGKAAIGQRKEQAVQAIEQIMRESTGPHVRVTPGGEAPGFFPGGAGGVRAEASGAVSTAPTLRVQGKDLTLREANDWLSEVGKNAFSKSPSQRTIEGVDQRQLYGAIARDIEQGLQPYRLARSIWDKAQEEFQAGMGWLKLTRPNNVYFANRDRLPPTDSPMGAIAEPLQGRGGATQYAAVPVRALVPQLGALYAQEPGVALNTGTLQNILQTPAGREAFLAKVGPEAFDRVMKILFPGTSPYQMPAGAQTVIDLLAQDALKAFPGVVPERP